MLPNEAGKDRLVPCAKRSDEIPVFSR